MESQYKLQLGDTKIVLKEMIEKGEKVDMIFTSPPYFSMRKNYSGNDVVLDPFAGSSTTGVASLKNNRKFIGIDLVEFNINFGRKRMDHYLETGETYIPKKELEEKDIDVNYYKIKGKHINNP